MKLCRQCKKLRKKTYLLKITSKGKKYVYHICSKCNLEKGKEFRKTESGKRFYKYDHKKYELKKNKIIARATVWRGLKNGSIIRPKKCSLCKKYKNLDAHHTDYKNPLHIIWVCRKCHFLIHQGKVI